MTERRSQARASTRTPASKRTPIVSRVSQLAANPDNPRDAKPSSLSALERSMDKYGDLSGIVWSRRTRRLVGGHQRLKHFNPDTDVVYDTRLAKPNAQGTIATGYIQRGNERWTFREVDVDEQTEAEMTVRANNPAGTWNMDRLRSMVTGLKAQGSDLETLGFDAAALQKLLQAGGAAAREPADLPPPSKPRSKSGTIYELGQHRLLCGDSRDGKLVDQLLEGIQPACVYTDPPYGVDYQGGAPIKNDHLKHNELAKMIAASLLHAVRKARDTAAFYVWHASETRRDFDAALAAVGLQERQQIIWVKPAIVLGWGDYLWGHEPMYYASKAGIAPSFYGDRTQPTTWRIAALTADGRLQIVIGPGVMISDGDGASLFIQALPPKGKKVRHQRLEPGQAMVLGSDSGTAWEVAREHNPQHPTQKPVALAVRAIMNSTKLGEWVYDSYAGSGNLLLGAEQTDRRAAVADSDPGYCDVIRQRYADLVQDAKWSPTGTLTKTPAADRPARGKAAQ